LGRVPDLSRRLFLAAATTPVLGAGAAVAGSAATGSGAAGSSGGHGPGCADQSLVASLLAHDMVGHHQGLMHGVPLTYDWAKGPHLGAGSNQHRFHAMNPWGQIYEAAQGSPAANVRVACKEISGWILSRRTGRWRQVAASRGVFGANYVEDFVGNVNKPAALRNEPDGSVSATLGGGYNFHFAPLRSRVVIDPADVDGVITAYSARVIMDDPHGPDERAEARYLASSGGDYWLNSTVGAVVGETNFPVGCGKARYLSPDWLTLTMSTRSLKKLARNCPPLCLRGR
jgi:hypothetical protein